MTTKKQTNEQLNLYLIEQSETCEYDTFDSVVVVAKNDTDAKQIHPYGTKFDKYDDDSLWDSSTWAKTPDVVETTYLGIADESLKEGSVVCASFNAG